MRYNRRKLLDDIDRGDIGPVYFFYGPEELLEEEALQSLIQRVVPAQLRDFNLDILYGDETSAAQIIDRASTLPMMSERRIVVVRKVNELSSLDKRRLLEFLKSPLPQSCLILLAAEININKGFYRDLQGVACCVGFFPLREGELSSWVRRRVQWYGKSIHPQALQLLCDSFTEGLHALDNEIQKLTIYVADKTTIEPQDVEVVVGELRTRTVYNLCDAVGSLDLGQAMMLLNHLLEEGAPAPLMVLSLRRHLCRLAQVRSMVRGIDDAEKVAAGLRIPLKYAGDYIRQSSNFSETDLEEALTQLHQTELRLKTGMQDPGMAMTLLVQQLCQLAGAGHDA